MKKLSLALLLGLLIPMVVEAAPFGWIVSAYDLTATSYTYCRMDTSTSTPVCGAAITNGWHRMPSGARAVTGAIEWITKNASSVDYSFECRVYNGSAYSLVLEQGSLTSATAKGVVITNEAAAFDECRIGLKIGTDTGANSVTAYFSTNQ